MYSTLVWHKLAAALAFASVLGCSGEATENETTERTDPEPSLEALGTAIHVVNGSAEMRARLSPCSGEPYGVGIRPASLDAESPAPTCSRIQCSSLSANETLAPSTECAAAACAPGRVDLAPGAADTDSQWDGVYLTLTERNCYEPTMFEPGTPMLAHVCFGTPANFSDLLDVSCTDHPFEYGAPSLEIELE